MDLSFVNSLPSIAEYNGKKYYFHYMERKKENERKRGMKSTIYIWINEEK